MVSHSRKSLCFVALLLSVSTLGCSSVGASSTRQILPSFHAQQLQHKRLLLAPYAVAALDPERAVPLETEDMESLAHYYRDPDPNRAALKVFYASSAGRAKIVLEKSAIGAGFVEIEPARWDAYFADPARFTAVTLDGKLRYDVPAQSLLKELGYEADYAIVIGSLAYQTTTRITKFNNSTTHASSADFEGHFLVWDYQQARILAEGKVESSVSIGKGATTQSIVDLGASVIEEILSKRPFHG